MKRGWVFVLWALGAAALVSLWWLAPMALRRMSLFQVRRLEVTGSRYFTAAEIAEAAKLPPGASIFDDTGPLHDRVLALPGVQRVVVHRRLPGALEIEVVEFEPVALVRTQNRVGLMDRRGRILPFDPTRSPADLPLAEADGEVGALIERVRETDSELHGAIEAVSRERNTIVLETVKHRLLFRVGATTKDIQGTAAVLAEIASRQWNVAELDARFEGRVIVRRRAR